MENSKEIFSIALGLVSPWTVESISFEETEAGKALYIFNKRKKIILITDLKKLS